MKKLNLQKERNKNKWTIRHTATIIGVDDSYYEQVERGLVKASKSLKDRLESIFELDYIYLLNEVI